MHQYNSVHVTHIPGVINPSDIFTREMGDSAHFRCLRDTMILSLEAFLQFTRCVPTKILDSKKILPYYSIRSPQDMESYATSSTASTPSLNKVSFAP